jgi:hypothetical protein
MSYQNIGSDDLQYPAIVVPSTTTTDAAQSLGSCPTRVSVGLSPFARWILLAVGIVELCFLVGALLGTWWAFDFHTTGGPPAPVYIQNNHYVGRLASWQLR